MTDLQILDHLLNGHHLNGDELERAKQLVMKLNIYLKQQ
jgi:hypothetical protein